ncbi:hypothetical protein EXIGLDRAFT_691797 [Exidia glandulosa HHB12029]|uniref:Uncharacterized protein n=1 Tax=Exidia glandulosa HHB12029 TaxID=1314781 RepID=A0A165IGP8_EXIGL|nr:hypothetical protein EXIGLDRAFT_691797 [Exidia glandulosa HHB12029]
MSSSRPKPLKKGSIDLTPKRHHGYAVILFIFGTLFPPLGAQLASAPAVAARFGIGGDFWLNLLLTIMGYIPGHAHNFYIQNIRNNKNHRRTPKWAIRYGLIDDSEIRRKKRKSQWANRYDERLPHSALEGQPYEADQNPGSRPDSIIEGQERPQRRNTNGDLWNPEEEQYYGAAARAGASSSSLPSAESSSTGRWHYPANFDGAEPEVAAAGKKKKKKDRWELSEDAHRGTLDEEYQRKKRKKRRSKRTDEPQLDRMESTDSVPEGPEDAVGGLYGPSRHETRPDPQQGQQRADDELFNHQF